MRVIRWLLWDDANIARHEVTPAEVEQVVFEDDPLLVEDDSHRRGRVLAFGVTTVGRHLVVVLDAPTATGEAYVVTARPMTERERKGTDETRRDGDGG